MKKEVGKIIKNLRSEKKLKQQFMAFKIGITVEAYANIENGRADVNTTRLKVIASILAIQAHVIIDLFNVSAGHKGMLKPVQRVSLNHR